MKCSTDNIAQNEGRRLDIKVYRKGRKCRKRDCKTPLSIYTEGHWCHAHMDYGFKIETNLEEIRVAKLKAEMIKRNNLKKLKGEL